MKKGGGGNKLPGALQKAVDSDLGGYDKFKADFIAAGTTQFGSGWAWVSVKDGKLAISKTPNGENPLVHGASPILGVDVWEHSYYIDYRNARPKYLEAFVDSLINWDHVLEMYEEGEGLSIRQKPRLVRGFLCDGGWSTRNHATVKERPGFFRRSFFVSARQHAFCNPEDLHEKACYSPSLRLALATSAAFADPIADRQAVMKENGKAVGVLVHDGQGRKALRRGRGAGGLEALTTTSQKFDVAASFPAGSDVGDTAASPKIWEDMAGIPGQGGQVQGRLLPLRSRPRPRMSRRLKPQFGAIGSELRRMPRDLRIKKD